MKNKMLMIILIIVLVFTIIYLVFNKKTAISYNNLAEKSMKKSQYIEALKYYKLAGNLLKKEGQKKKYIKSLNDIGVVYYSLGKYDKAVEIFKKALIFAKELGDKGEVTTDLNNIGAVYYSLGKYDKAIDNFRKALIIAEELGDRGEIAIDLNNIGMVYDSWGQYDKAIENYKRSLSIAKELGKKDSITAGLNNIGRVYDSWGQYEKAIDHFRKALSISKALGKKGNTAVYLSNIGRGYSSLGKYDKAIENYNKALIIDQNLGRKGKVATRLSNIGVVYYALGQYDKAIENYKKALAIAEELGQKREIATRLSNIGSVYYSLEQYDKAMENYRKALSIDRELGRKAGRAIRLNNIGTLYHSLKNYKKAEYNLNKSIKIIEEIRLTAKGIARIDYLASQILSYQYLISTYIRNKKPDLAFNIIEMSSAKYLIEQMGSKLDAKKMKFSGIKNYQNNLDENNAIINYSNINWSEFSQIIVDKNNIYAIEVDKNHFITKINKKHKNIILNMTKNLRGFKAIKRTNNILKNINKTDNTNFDEILNYYRLLLSKSDLSSREARIANKISKELYLLLFGNIEKYLKGKDELIIIPDGILSFLPFETLIMPDGRYLIEKYHVKYTQSLAVSEIIKKRNYNLERKPLLAFGGAVYDEISYNTDLINSEKYIKNLKKQTLLAINRGQSTRDAYNVLGITNWNNLPGTIVEVKSIMNIVKGSEIHTGKDVTESKLKYLSKNGDLKKYKVLHFATHGLVVPELPELSAIVLSQFKEEQNNEDGYLTMKEIVELDFNADFINLSGCDTGLGKIYGGEGVVGLSQSFLVAGANGLSVSLWQVADKSTVKFMTGVYQLVNIKGLRYDKAITAMKRAFISGKTAMDSFEIGSRGFENPFYWAPFVYYGK